MLEVDDLTKEYGDVTAVDELSFTIEQGEFVTLLGPSGCGKSTTLHCIAGLTIPTEGEIRLRNENVTTKSANERNIGMVFQSRALFPHMTVGENISYGLKMHKFSSDSIQNQVNKYLELVEMVDYIDQKPNELSGGQQQRISIARALAYEPDILLLDEPLTGLDRVLRENLRNEIIQVQHEVDITTLYVTHDQEEALAMSDRVIVLNEGQKQQVGPPDELYRNPKNEFVAEFIGKSTKFTGKPVSNSPDIVSIGTNEIQVNFEHESIGEEVTIFVRPQHITINNNDPTTQGPNTYRAKIKQIENLGNRAEVEAELMDGKILTAESDSFPDFKIDDEVSVHIDSEEVIVL